MQATAIIGAQGQLGSDLVRSALRRGVEVRALEHEEIEITDADSVERALSALRPRIVINTAACQGATHYTAADQGAFFQGNALGPWNLARWCARHDVPLVQFSTDYVFSGRAGEGPYRESDAPGPINVYGASKLAGEQLVRATSPAHYVIRVASLYGLTGSRAKGGSNFVKMVLDKARGGEPLSIVADQTMSPTWTHDAAEKTFDLIESGADPGIYHMAGRGSCTWYELASEIAGLSGLDAEIRPIATQPEEAGAGFLRPRNTALDNAALRSAGIDDLPDWRESLKNYVLQEVNRVASGGVR